jgi:hypothetical protein
MDDFSTPKLRRAWLSGYRVSDVEVLLAQFRMRVTGLQRELDSLKDRLLRTESERDGARTLVAELSAERETAIRAGRTQVEQMLEEARLDAARIRAAAALEEERTRTRVEELLKLRDTLATTIRSVTRDFERTMAGVEEPPAAEPTPEPAPVAPAVPDVFPAAHTGDLFDRRVELEAGPFEDFASLAAFEQALGGLSKVEDVYIRRFEGDQATIEVTLHEPAHLLDEMNARLPYRLTVDVAEHDRIALKVGAE